MGSTASSYVFIDNSLVLRNSGVLKGARSSMMPPQVQPAEEFGDAMYTHQYTCGYAQC